MEKRSYSEAEIEFLSQFPEVFKQVRSDRITFTQSFRLKVWESVNGRRITASDVRKLMDEIDPGISKLFRGSGPKGRVVYNLAMELNRDGRPSRAANKVVGIPMAKESEILRDNQALLDSGWFVKGKTKGISFTDNLLKELTIQLETRDLKEALLFIGIKPEWMGYQMFQRLKRTLEGKQAVSAPSSYSSETVSELKQNPYVKSVASKQLRFRPEFYQIGSVLFEKHSLKEILDLFGIPFEKLSIGTVQAISHKFRHQPDPKLAVLKTDDHEYNCRFCQDLISLLERDRKQFNEDLTALWKDPDCSNAQKREICLYIKEISQTEGSPCQSELLRQLGINRSTYYSILKDETYGLPKPGQKERDEADLKLIQEVVEEDPFRKGSRQVRMQLEDRFGRKMSLKRIQKLMRENGLKCTIRQKRHSHDSSLINRKKPNLLKRRFRLFKPYQVLLTDVSYLFYGENQLAYLSCVKDPSSGKIVSARISESNDMALVTSNFEDLEDYSNSGCLLHSDQGILYLSPEYQEKAAELGFVQSMSGRGVCWDNAPQESFFGTFKSETDYKDTQSVEELQALMDRYKDYYNNRRPQAGRMKMTPAAFEEHLLNMNESDFESYRSKEEEKYRQMMRLAREKAIKANKEGKMAVYEQEKQWNEIRQSYRSAESGS